MLIEPGILREHPHLKSYDPVEKDHLPDFVDFIVTFGGDGTILHLGSVFQREVCELSAVCACSVDLGAVSARTCIFHGHGRIHDAV